jgi:DNA-binding response OmpR family regulator
MNERTIRMLHVEDDTMQQMIIARHLKKIPDLHIAVTCVRSEEEAVAEFQRSPRDFIILDYHLSEGNGLSCLRSLRKCDPIVPIIAISGQATDAIAAQLLESGADDFISKRDLQGDLLARSVQLALTRADAWRRRHPVADEGRVSIALREVCKGFAASAGPDFLSRLDAFDAAAREAGLTPEQLRNQLEAVCAELTAARPTDEPTVKRYLRPVLLELQQRLADAAQVV